MNLGTSSNLESWPLPPPRRLRVAYLFSRYPVPSQTFCDTEIRALEAAGFEVEIWSCSPPTTSFRHGVADWPRARVSYAPPPDALAKWEASARRVGRWPAATIARHETAYGARYAAAKRARHTIYFADLLQRQGVEHVHVHFANRATHAALFLHELTGVPFSFTAHAQDFLVDLGSDDLLREMCARAAFVVAVSDWSRRALVEKCPSSAGKIHRVYNGLPLERWPTPAPSGPASRWRIFSIGRLVEFKGFADLIDACALLQARGLAFQCEIAGEGPLTEKLSERIRAVPGLDSSVRLVGLLTQDEIRARLAGCDVFALACRTDEKGACDVLPTVILEAMAAGRPVVSTQLAGVPEMVADGETGLLVPPGDPTALADALERLRANPELGNDLGRAGRARLADEFTADRSAAQLGALLLAAAGDCEAGVPVEAPSATLILVAGWPFAGSLEEARDRLPGARWLALTIDAGAFDLDYLPDALVLETWWRAFAAEAHRIEAWRDALGGSCPTDDFLRAARRALYLHFSLERESVPSRHVHAIGAEAVLVAWILMRLGSVDTASLSLGPDTALTGGTLRRLAVSFTGGWIAGERKLAAALGPGFRADEPSVDDWAHQLKNPSNSGDR